MRIKSWNILTFVLSLFICCVFLLCLNLVSGTYTICVAENGSTSETSDGEYMGIGYLGGIDPWYYPDSLGGQYLGGSYLNLGFYMRKPSKLEIAASKGDISTLAKYTEKIGITAYGYPSATAITYPNMAGMSTMPNVFDYTKNYLDYLSTNQATWNYFSQGTGLFPGGSIYDSSYMMSIWPSTLFSPAQEMIYGGFDIDSYGVCGPLNMWCGGLYTQ